MGASLARANSSTSLSFYFNYSQQPAIVSNALPSNRIKPFAQF